MRRAAMVVLGAYLGFIGAVVHRHAVELGGVTLPWGLVLTVAATFAITLAANQVARLGGAFLGMGWGLSLMAQQLSPGGSYLVATDWLGWSFTVGGLGAIVIGVLREPRVTA